MALSPPVDPIDTRAAEPAATSADLPPTKSRRGRRAHWTVYLALAPIVLVLGVFAYYPAINGIVFSFFDWNPGFESFFIGFDNYAKMLDDDLWWASFRNLGIIFVASVTVWWALPFLAAELVVTLRSRRLQFVFRTLLIVPFAFPGVVTALVWEYIYHPNNGVLNRLLEAIGLPFLQHNWIGQSDTALIALLFVGFPWVASLPFLVFLAALQNIPTEVFDAASLDGVGRFRRVFAIDLPLLVGQFRLLLFLAVVFVLQYGFTAFLITNGGPNFATTVPVLRMLSVAFQGGDWGYAAAMSSVLFVIILAMSSIVLATGRRESRNV